MRRVTRFPHAQVLAAEYELGDDVTIGPGTVIVADRLVLEDGVVIGAGCDLRAGVLAMHRNARVGDGGAALVSDELRLGPATVLDRDANITCREFTVHGSSYLGPRFTVGYGATMEARSVVALGERCQIGPDVIVNATEPVTFGSDVGVGAFVSLWTHGYHPHHSVLDGFSADFAGVRVDDGVWLAYHATVLPGVVVGRNSIVAALTVVTTDVPPEVLFAGIPGRVKRKLDTAALGADQRRRTSVEVVHAWLDRLAYKGCTVEPAGNEWLVTRPGGSAWRIGWQSATGATLRVSGTAGPEPVLFDFDTLRITGSLDDLTHDLRDFCRRRTLYFPCTENSVSLTPERFARLLRAVPAPSTAASPDRPSP